MGFWLGLVGSLMVGIGSVFVGRNDDDVIPDGEYLARGGGPCRSTLSLGPVQGPRSRLRVALELCMCYGLSVTLGAALGDGSECFSWGAFGVDGR